MEVCLPGQLEVKEVYLHPTISDHYHSLDGKTSWERIGRGGGMDEGRNFF